MKIDERQSSVVIKGRWDCEACGAGLVPGNCQQIWYTAGSGGGDARAWVNRNDGDALEAIILK